MIKYQPVPFALMVMTSIILAMIVEQSHGKPTIAMQSLEPVPGGAMDEYKKVKLGLQERRREMCSFLLTNLDGRDDEKLELDKVTRLFEASLEHLAKTSDYVSLMQPYVPHEVISNFDENAGKYVLNISDTRRKLIEEYENAVASGESEQKKRELLEGYFFKACDSKLSTIVTEKAMYESAQKAEKVMRVKLLDATNGDH